MNKSYLVFVVLVILGATTVYGQNNNSVLHFEHKLWDFGNIAQANGKVSHSFEFTNTGTIPVVIESVEVSCGCTIPSYSRAPVMPGKKSYIEITYDPTNRPGSFLKTIVVRSGNGGNINTISISGTVTARPQSVEEEYPVKAQQGIRFTTASVDFNRVGQGQARIVTIGCMNTSNKEAALKAVPVGVYSWLKVTTPEKICVGCRGEITFTIDLTQTTVWGTQTIPINLYLGGVKLSTGLVVSALFIDNFDKPTVASGARSKLDAQFFHFGNVNADFKSISHEFTLGNEGNTPLILRAVQYDKGVTATLRDGVAVEPGDSLRFTVTIVPVPGELSADRLLRSIKLIMNDPMRPIREIRLVGDLVNN